MQYWIPLAIFIFSGCLVSESVDDSQKVAALRNVTLGFDSMSVHVGLPAGALSGSSFNDLRTANPDEYENLANYSITLSLHQTADNTSSSAEDAHFSGMRVETQFDTLSAETVDLVTPAFEIPKGTKASVLSEGSLNLETHKGAGKYIFQQMAAGLDLDTKMISILLYDIGSLSGEITLPQITQSIPTRASPEMQTFLTDLLNSGLLD